MNPLRSLKPSSKNQKGRAEKVDAGREFAWKGPLRVVRKSGHLRDVDSKLENWKVACFCPFQHELSPHRPVHQVDETAMTNVCIQRRGLGDKIPTTCGTGAKSERFARSSVEHMKTSTISGKCPLFYWLPYSFLLLLPSRLFHLSYCQPSHRNLEFGFDVEKVIHVNTAMASRSWELGATAEGLIELRNPELTVFANDPFHEGRIQSWRNADCPSKDYACVN